MSILMIPGSSGRLAWTVVAIDTVDEKRETGKINKVDLLLLLLFQRDLQG